MPFKTIDATSQKRLQKELKTLKLSSSLDGIKVDQCIDLSTWSIEIEGPPGSLYHNETFSLCFQFNANYPFDSPIVTFVGDTNAIPIHQHVYSNGHICLSILSDDWSPALTVESVCMSIISMLASSKEKKRPKGDKNYVQTCHKNPKKTRWLYDDDRA